MVTVTVEHETEKKNDKSVRVLHTLIVYIFTDNCGRQLVLTTLMDQINVQDQISVKGEIIE